MSRRHRDTAAGRSNNGAYIDWKHGNAFDENRYMKRLSRAQRIGAPDFAVIPDIVGGGLRSLSYSMAWLERLPIEWPWYLALQDGMTENDIVPVVNRVGGLFLGGTDRFKREAESWAQFAREHSKPFHFARAGTEPKIKQAMRIGADSLDSSLPLWNFRRLHRMEYLVTEWPHAEPRLVNV